MRAKKTEQPKLEIVYRKLTDLTLDPNNARTHSDAQISEIAGAIERFGYSNPVLIDETLMIRAGEGRYLGAERAGLEELPTIMRTGLTEKQWRALALADNRIALNSSWDSERLRDTLAELRDDDELGIDGLGFGKSELDALFGDKAEPVEVVEIETTEVLDRFWISIRGDLKHQAETLRRLHEVLKDVPGVEVELGTIGLDG